MDTLTRLLKNFWLYCTGTDLIDSLVHGAPNDYERNVPALKVRLECRWNDETQHRLPVPKLKILAVDADVTPPEEWDAEGDVEGGLLDPRAVKAARQKEIQYLWERGGVRVLH